MCREVKRCVPEECRDTLKELEDLGATDGNFALGSWRENPILIDEGCVLGIFVINDSFELRETKLTVEGEFVKSQKNMFHLDLVSRAVHILESMVPRSGLRFYVHPGTNLETGSEDELLVVKKANLGVIIAPIVFEENEDFSQEEEGL